MLFYLFPWMSDTSPADCAEKSCLFHKELSELVIARTVLGEKVTLSRLSTPHSPNDDKLVHLSFMLA